MHTGFVDDKSPAENELDALRRRANGPDADIGADPLAQARLAELERHHATRESYAPGGARTASPIEFETIMTTPASQAARQELSPDRAADPTSVR